MSTIEPRRPPLAGKPPFATDDPDELFEQPPISRRRVRKLTGPNPNDRTSAYNMYDEYLGDVDATNRQSGLGALGLGLLNENLSDDDEDEDALMRKSPMATEPSYGGTASATPIPLAAPRPGYPVPVAALNLPSPVPTPEMRQLAQPAPVIHSQSHLMPSALKVNRSAAHTLSPRMPPPIYETPSARPSVPNAPHPLQPPMSPITPVFARPVKSPAPRDIHFTNDTIIRGGLEDKLMPKRGQRGDDFWRRFSIVAKEDKKTSSWLSKTQSGSSKLSRSVWFIGIVLLLCIAGSIGIGWYMSHKSPSNTAPKAIGGSAHESKSPTTLTTAVSSSSFLHVSPTNTVARREYDAIPTHEARFLQEARRNAAPNLNVSGRSRRHHRRVGENKF